MNRKDKRLMKQWNKLERRSVYYLTKTYPCPFCGTELNFLNMLGHKLHSDCEIAELTDDFDRVMILTRLSAFGVPLSEEYLSSVLKKCDLMELLKYPDYAMAVMVLGMIVDPPSDIDLEQVRTKLDLRDNGEEPPSIDDETPPKSDWSEWDEPKNQ